MTDARETVHEAATLLPWYLNGTLAPAESRAVEDHLATCVGCREEAERGRALRGVVAATVDARPAPPSNLFALVLSRIEHSKAASARVASVKTPWWGRVAAGVFEFVPARLAPAAALVVIILQFGALAVLGTMTYRAPRHPEVITQSGPDGRRPSAGTVRLRIAFDDKAPEREIRGLLQRLDARIVDGPTAAGFYIVEAPATTAAGRAIDDLRGRTDLIRYAEELPPGSP